MHHLGRSILGQFRFIAYLRSCFISNSVYVDISTAYVAKKAISVIAYIISWRHVSFLYILSPSLWFIVGSVLDLSTPIKSFDDRVLAISSVRIYFVVVGQWSSDGSWAYNPMLAIETSEIGGTLIALSIPALKPLFGSWFSHIKADTSRPTQQLNGLQRSGYGRNTNHSWKSRHNGKSSIELNFYSVQLAAGEHATCPPTAGIKGALGNGRSSDDFLLG